MNRTLFIDMMRKYGYNFKKYISVSYSNEVFYIEPYINDEVFYIEPYINDYTIHLYDDEILLFHVIDGSVIDGSISRYEYKDYDKLFHKIDMSYIVRDNIIGDIIDNDLE